MTRPAGRVFALVGLVVVATIVQIWLASRIVTPWILIDELIYSDLARSLGDTARFTCVASRFPGRTSATSC